MSECIRQYGGSRFIDSTRRKCDALEEKLREIRASVANLPTSQASQALVGTLHSVRFPDIKDLGSRVQAPNIMDVEI